jgi:hypothetical protein
VIRHDRNSPSKGTGGQYTGQYMNATSEHGNAKCQYFVQILGNGASNCDLWTYGN